ncbi:MAG: IS256 family transposase [Candidatus Binatia bacterium]
MGRWYRKTRSASNRGKRTTSGGRRPQIVGRDEALSGRIGVELPVSLADVIEGVSDEIEQLAGQAGLLIMREVMDAEVASLAGPKGKHDPDRRVFRWGEQAGYAVVGGAKVRVEHPRVRDRTGREVALRSYERFQSPPRRQRSIVKALVHGISTRTYDKAVEKFTEGYGLSKSAVSRELMEGTRGSLQKLCERRIDELPRLVVLMIDGKDFAGEHVIVALGVDETGKKHVLGLVQGGTENSIVVQHLLDDLVERGLDTRQAMLLVLDGSKALRKAVTKTFGERCPVQRCQIHKRRNVKDHLPPEYQGSADQRIRTAYAMKDHDKAKAQLVKTVAWLEGINPSAASSLREGLEETLTLHRLGLPESLRKSLQSTNLIESALSVAADVTRRVKRWRGGDMRLRWTAAGLLQAEKNFRRIRGYKAMARFLTALDRHDVAETTQAA